jgi:uncharacterized membrane protein
VAPGLVRSVQLVGTLVVAIPVALLGVLTALEGRSVTGAFFVAMAVGLVVVSEYVYTRLTDRTVGRLRRLRDVR